MKDPIDIFPLWLILLLLVALPFAAGGLARRRSGSDRGVKRRIRQQIFGVTVLVSLVFLITAPFYLTDSFEGPGVWWFFASGGICIEIALLGIAGITALVNG